MHFFFGKHDAWKWGSNGLPGALYPRVIASHGVTLEAGRLREVIGKWTGVTGFGRHYGLDIPVGGLGNPAPDAISDDFVVGPAGVPYKLYGNSSKLDRDSDLQHGHLYIYMNEHTNCQSREVGGFNKNSELPDGTDSHVLLNPSCCGTATETLPSPQDYGGNLGSILFGIERSAPLKEDLLGGFHSPECVQGSLSAFGKRKWRDYWQSNCALPASIGGMHVRVGKRKLKAFERFLATFPLCRPSEGYIAGKEQDEERLLFRSLLQSSAEEAYAIIRRHLNDLCVNEEISNEDLVPQTYEADSFDDESDEVIL